MMRGDFAQSFIVFEIFITNPNMYYQWGMPEIWSLLENKQTHEEVHLPQLFFTRKHVSKQ
jgi:hypothetical protein